MAMIERPQNYTAKDFETLRIRLRNVIKTVFPNWDTEAVASFGNILLDMFALVGDMLSYYNDAYSNEAFVPTAKQLRSLLLFAEQWGLDLPLQSAASADVTFMLENPISVDVKIPVGTRVATIGDDPVTFEVVTEGVIPAGNTSVVVPVANWNTVQERVIPTGEPWFEVALGYIPFLEIVDVVDSDGVVWTQQRTLVNSGPNDAHFVLFVDDQGVGRLRFGDGNLGKIPTSNLLVTYRYGGGFQGNVAAHTITRLVDTLKDQAGNTVKITVDNNSSASGGAERITPDQARRLIPSLFATQYRTVSKEDFEARALSVPGVARAVMLTSDTTLGIPENTGHLIIIPEGGGEPSQALKDAVIHKVTVEYPCPVTFTVRVFGPRYLNVNVITRVYFEPFTDITEVARAISETLQELFKISKDNGKSVVRFGGEYVDRFGNPDHALPYSTVYDAVFNVDGVRKIKGIELNGVNGDLHLEPHEFPVLGSITIIDADTNQVVTL